jgi:hypothetical protein
MDGSRLRSRWPRSAAPAVRSGRETRTMHQTLAIRAVAAGTVAVASWGCGGRTELLVVDRGGQAETTTAMLPSSTGSTRLTTTTSASSSTGLCAPGAPCESLTVCGEVTPDPAECGLYCACARDPGVPGTGLYCTTCGLPAPAGGCTQWAPCQPGAGCTDGPDCSCVCAAFGAYRCTGSCGPRRQ